MTAERVTPVRELEARDDDRPPVAGGPPRYFALSEPTPGVILAGTCGRKVARSDDGGETWTVVGDLFQGSNVNAFTPGGHGELYAAAGAAGIAVSYDDGASWSAIDCGGASVFCLAVLDRQLIAGTTDGIIVRGPGGDWSHDAAGPRSEVYRLLPVGEHSLAAATESAGVWLRSGEQGWRSIGLADVPVFAVIELDGGDLLAGTRGRGILRWVRDTGDWREVTGRPADSVVHTIQRRLDGSLVAGTGQGIVAAGADGEHWSPLGRELAHHRMFSLVVRSDGSLVAGTYDGVWAFDDALPDWFPLDTGLDVGAVFAIGVHGGVVYAGGRAGVFRTDDAGDSWSAIRPADHSGNAYAFCWSDGDLYVATDDGVWHAGKGLPGEEWTRAGLDGLRPFTLIEQAPGRLLAGTLGDGVWIRPEVGSAWRRTDLEHPLAFDLMRSPSTGQVFVATGDLARGRKSGGIFRSADGERWEPCELEPNTVYDLVETAAGTILAGAQRSRILRSDDGGRSFATTRPQGRDDSKMYCLHRDPGDRLYLGAGNELLCSDDAGDSWQVVGRGLDGVTVYGVVGLDDRTLLAATSSGVYRSTDAALTWVPAGWSA